MDKSTVIELLRGYREQRARCEFLRAQMEVAEAYIEDMKRTAVEDSIHITSTWDGLPHGNGVSSPVEALAVRLADGEYSPHIKAEIQRLSMMQIECRELSGNVRCVEIWLAALTERQRFTVEQTLIEGHTWPETERIFEERYGYFCSYEGLRKVRNTAVQMICRIAR